jgi:uncharacterized membrane protein YqhA
MLKAVIFYIIGVGLYNLFISPLNLPVALGVETLGDLEAKVVSVVIVIMAVDFLEHFILWQQGAEILQFGITLSIVTAALVAFQVYCHWAKADAQHQHPQPRLRAPHELFDEGQVQQVVVPPASAPRTTPERD